MASMILGHGYTIQPSLQTRSNTMKIGDLVRHVSYNSIGIVLTAANYRRQREVAWVDGTTTMVKSHSLEVI